MQAEKACDFLNEDRIVDQLKNYADGRLLSGCTYCGSQGETRDHVPSRVFLDTPYPENLPVVEACWRCNNGFSLDEEYVACLIESVIAGSSDPTKIRRPGVAEILKRSAALRTRIESSKNVENERILFQVEHNRISRVLLKLARGHAAYELAQECRDEATAIWWKPLELFSEEELDAYDSVNIVQTFGEIGSRGVQRLLVAQVTAMSPCGESVANLLVNDWVDVQDGRYRYHAIDDGDLIRVKIVIGEYLASEVIWER